MKAIPETIERQEAAKIRFEELKLKLNAKEDKAKVLQPNFAGFAKQMQESKNLIVKLQN